MMLVKVIDSEFVEEVFSGILLERLHVVEERRSEGQKVVMGGIHDVQGAPAIASKKFASDEF
jgi:hypothetical protein